MVEPVLRVHDPKVRQGHTVTHCDKYQVMFPCLGVYKHWSRLTHCRIKDFTFHQKKMFAILMPVLFEVVNPWVLELSKFIHERFHQLFVLSTAQ